MTARHLIALDEETLHFGLKFGERTIERFAPGIEDDGPLGTQRSQLKPDRFANATFDAVANDGFAEGFGSGKPDARTLEFRFGEAKSGEQGTSVSGPVVVNFSEIAGAEDPGTFGKAC